MKFTRRKFLRRSTQTAAALPFVQFFTTRPLFASTGLKADGSGILDLPSGFTYKVIDRRGAKLTDGNLVPKKPDGMGFFVDANGNWVLMRNHEIDLEDGDGGVCKLVLNPESLEIIESKMVLQGTDRNCNGGVSPWGWLTCEESRLEGSGYVYLCPIDESKSVSRIDGYGRFCHEAAEVDPENFYVYLTEDEDDSCFYRFVPDSKTTPYAGKLQALKIKGQNRAQTTNMRLDQTLEVEWVDIADPQAKTKSTREQAQAAGAAIFRNGEGMASFGGKIYFSATRGGSRELGQIFSLTPTDNGGTLDLVSVSQNENQFDCPDALVCSSRGDLFLAEDGDDAQYIKIIKTNGEIKTFAKNAAGNGELAGLCFSTDEKVLFINLQKEGITVAVNGPFGEL